MQNKISVIIPVYNVEEFLSRCLDSVVNQTLKDIEIICVNDGSTDNSLKILEEYSEKDKRLIVINQENKGQSSARNVGMSIASGEYIGFVDSDDWIDLDFYERLYKTAKKHDACMACSSIIRKYKSGKSKEKLSISKEEVFSSAKEKYVATNTPGMSYVWNKIYNRKELSKFGLKFKEGIYFEDVGFTIRALYFLKTLVTVPYTSYYYWVNYKSITREMTDKKQQDKLESVKDFIEFSKQHHINCDEKWYIKSKTVYKLFSIPILKIYEWETIKKYYLFSVIYFFEIRKSL